jgi:hypothetical protein
LLASILGHPLLGQLLKPDACSLLGHPLLGQLLKPDACSLLGHPLNSQHPITNAYSTGNFIFIPRKNELYLLHQSQSKTPYYGKFNL